jgi:cysteine-rich repeat protein
MRISIGLAPGLFALSLSACFSADDGGGGSGEEVGMSSTDTDTTSETTASSETTETGEPDPVCGNGVVEAGEACDDGNDDDTDECTSACAAAACGDGFVQVGVEGCDDGNTEDGDGCSSSCTMESCGDGAVQGMEECDDGNAVDADACTNLCMNAVCGDGIVYEGVEGCDDGNDDDGDACLSSCAIATCGDGVLHVGVEECDGAQLDGATCQTYGFLFGDLACSGACTHDLSDCVNNPCPSNGAYVSNMCWYASAVCESAVTKCQALGLTGADGSINVVWDMATMNLVAAALGLNAGGDVGCCVNFGWIENGSIFTHNFGAQFHNWNGCYNNFPTLKACNPP